MNGQVKTQGSVRDAIRAFFEQERRNSERIEKYNRGLSEEDELPPYTHIDYPKALYANDGEAIVVQTAAEERVKLQEGFYPSYAALQEAIERVNATHAEPAEASAAEEAPRRRR